MKIAIVGTGYVGTVAGACFAEVDNEVICVDKDREKVNALSSGSPVIFEPGLEALLTRNLESRRLSFTSSLTEAVARADILFMTVGTPSLPSGEPDLSFLEDAVREIARAMKTPKIIVNKSTVPVGTHRKVAQWMSQETDVPFEIVSNPEFLREGAAIQDFLHPERVVIGTYQSDVFQLMRQLYLPFCVRPDQILRMDPISAEMTKYACNAFLATRISFMNELAQLCEKTGGDIESIREGMSLDSRIGKHFLKAGIGYGGSCFPKDIRALVSTAHEAAVPLRVVKAAEDANENQKRYLVHLVQSYFSSSLKGKVFALWGVAFKPNTDDIREAPALILASELVKRGARVQAYDPVALENARTAVGDLVDFSRTAMEAAAGADAVIIATDWDEFKNLNFQKLREALNGPVIFDGRNCIDPRLAASWGFKYFGIGRSVKEINPLPSATTGIATQALSA
jgi:UDPglucose 6-dehydrogenase